MPEPSHPSRRPRATKLRDSPGAESVRRVAGSKLPRGHGLAASRLAALRRAAHRTRAKADPERLQHELQVHQLELEAQNEELRRAQVELETALQSYTDLYDFAPAAYLTLQPNGTILQANRAAASLLSLERSGLLGRRFGIFVAPESSAAFSTLLARAFETKKTEVGEVGLWIEDTRPITVHLQLWASQDGKECRVTLTDLTKLREAETALRENEERLRSALAVVDLGTWDLDLATGIAVRSLRHDQIFGYRKLQPEWTLEIMLRHVLPEDRQMVLDAHARAREIGEVSVEVRVRWPDGSIHWIAAHGRVHHDGKGRAVRIMGVVGDITQRKQAELRIEALASLGRRLNVAQSAREAGEIIVEVADQLLGWDACLFDLYSAAENRTSCLLSMDVIDGRRTECISPEPRRTPTGAVRRAIDQGGQLILRDNAAAMRPEALPFGDRSRASASLMFVPTRHGAEVVGILSIQSYTPNAYSASSLQTLQALADHAGGALARLRTAEALRRHQALLEAVTEGTTDAIFIKDAQGRHLMSNSAAAALVGKPKAEVVGRDNTFFFTPDEAGQLMERDRQVIASGATQTYEEFLLVGGVKRMFLTTKGPVRDSQGKVVGLFGIARDITERKQAEETLRESEARLNEAQRNARIGSWRYLPDRPFGWSDQMYVLFHQPRDVPVTYEAVLAVIHPDDRTSYSRAFEPALESGALDFQSEYRVVQPDGQVRTLFSLGKIHRAADGRVLEAVGTAQDITERKQAEEELRRLSARLLQLRDEEQRHLARELHSSTVQDLAAIMVNLSFLRQVTRRLRPDAERALQDSLTLADRAATELRTISYLLHPPLLEELGLEGAVREFAAGFARRTGVRVDLELPPELGRMPEDIELALFRVIQESVSNIHRHSGSDSAQIALHRSGEEIRLEVRDGGHGFILKTPAGAEPAPELGVGITGMRERLRQLGGRLEITSSSAGTIVRAMLPCAQPGPAALA